MNRRSFLKGLCGLALLPLSIPVFNGVNKPHIPFINKTKKTNRSCVYDYFTAEYLTGARRDKIDYGTVLLDHDGKAKIVVRGAVAFVHLASPSNYLCIVEGIKVAENCSLVTLRGRRNTIVDYIIT